MLGTESVRKELTPFFRIYLSLIQDCISFIITNHRRSGNDRGIMAIGRSEHLVFLLLLFMQTRQMKMYSDKEGETEYEKKKRKKIVSVRKEGWLVG